MKTFSALVMGVFVGLGAHVAWATIAVNAATPACADSTCYIPILNVVIVDGGTIFGNPLGVPVNSCVLLDDDLNPTCVSASAKRLTYDGSNIKLMSGGSTFLACSNSTGICDDSFGFMSSISSGNNAFSVTTNGARIDFGAGTNDFASSDGTTVTFAGPVTAVGPIVSTGNAQFRGVTSGGSAVDLSSGLAQIVTAGGVGMLCTNSTATCAFGTEYTPSGTPFSIASVYVNNIPQTGFVYGGGTLPAHAFTVQAIRYYVRTAGSGGTTNANFQIIDGSSDTCNCTYACNDNVGVKRASCSSGAGTGCAFAASAALTYKYTTPGDCAATSADIVGNIEVEGIWQ